MRITPIKNIENTKLGLTEPEWAVLGFSVIFGQFICAIFQTRYWWIIGTVLVFIAIRVKKQVEKKEQNYFGVLFSNMKIANKTIGIFNSKKVNTKKESSGETKLFK